MRSTFPDYTYNLKCACYFISHDAYLHATPTKMVQGKINDWENNFHHAIASSYIQSIFCKLIICIILIHACIRGHITCRFTAEEKANRPQHCYVPFGSGPRNCIGMRLALLETKIALIELLKRFTFQRTPDTQVINFDLPGHCAKQS